MGFDPVLPAGELTTGDGLTDAQVLQAQRDVVEADAVTVVYPLWWLSMPAMIKGYVDRVFARGFAYESRNGVVHGLLSGKKSVLITISGAPLPLLVRSGNWNAVQVLQDTHILRATGFTLLEHVHFDEIVPNLPHTVADRCMGQIRDCVRRHFA